MLIVPLPRGPSLSQERGGVFFSSGSLRAPFDFAQGRLFCLLGWIFGREHGVGRKRKGVDL
jgi:hypothetical protein